ncbi:MAG TPA: tetratricopeptide repeat protein, partial [Blastocatellia bacterium]|nr:tetratricopeptide repeat protein [Blastocatellia bacterium]
YELERVTLFYSDHPALEERLSYVTAAITKVNAESVDSQAAAENRARYLSTTERGAQHDIALEIQSGRFRTAHALSQKLLKFNPMSSENCYYSAESYRALGPRPAEPTTRELSPEGRKENARLKQKYLVEEQEKLLIATAGGQEVFKDNIAKAEAMYRRSIELDPKNPKPHRSLAVLLEKSERYSEALEEHRRYLELEPKALDRALVERQVEALRTRLAAGKN